MGDCATSSAKTNYKQLWCAQIRKDCSLGKKLKVTHIMSKKTNKKKTENPTIDNAIVTI